MLIPCEIMARARGRPTLRRCGIRFSLFFLFEFPAMVQSMLVLLAAFSCFGRAAMRSLWPICFRMFLAPHPARSGKPWGLRRTYFSRLSKKRLVSVIGSVPVRLRRVMVWLVSRNLALFGSLPIRPPRGVINGALIYPMWIFLVRPLGT